MLAKSSILTSRIFEYIPSGEQKSPISRPNTCHTAKQGPRWVITHLPSSRLFELTRKWEILGDLALRLQHKEEAKDAFQRCLDSKFSAKALLKLLEMYATEGDLQRTLNIAIRLTTYHHRYVSSFSTKSTHQGRQNCTDEKVVYGCFVSLDGGALLVQAGLDTRTRKDSVYTPQHGTSQTTWLWDGMSELINRTYQEGSLRSCRGTWNTARRSISKVPSS